MAQPTMRALSLEPKNEAITPYDVARPEGIWRTTSYTSLKKFLDSTFCKVANLKCILKKSINSVFSQFDLPIRHTILRRIW